MFPVDLRPSWLDVGEARISHSLEKKEARSMVRITLFEVLGISLSILNTYIQK
jgi:hypothetical protein